LHLLCKHLKDDGITHLRLGFVESRFTEEDFFRLDQRIRTNRSLRTVEIGNQLPNTVLFRILESLIHLPSLQRIYLESCPPIPESLLQRLLSKTTLSDVELNDIVVSPISWTQRIRMPPTAQSVWTHSRREENISTMLNHFSGSIRRVELSSLIVDSECALQISAWTKSRSEILDELSLAHSVRITPKAIDILCRETVCRRLNLTSCNLQDDEMYMLASSLQDVGSIEELILSHNHTNSRIREINRTGCRGWWNPFITSALSHLRVLDISSCGLSREEVHDILQRLGGHDEEKANKHRLRLETLRMMGIQGKRDDDEDEEEVLSILLNQILKRNTRLKKLYVSPCMGPSSSTVLLEESLFDIYTMEELEVGCSSPRIDMYLALNRAGRKFLREDHGRLQDDTTDEGWFQILLRASSHPDVLLWLLQHAPYLVNGSGRTAM